MSPLSRFLAATNLPEPVQLSAAGDVAMLWFRAPSDLEAWATALPDVERSVVGEAIGTRTTPLWLYRFTDWLGYSGWLIHEGGAA
ncbi:MAG TPA: hypothetical protein VFC00_30865 [Micromonosporaceae bacterium]|nr:hypothetical protein [Micromonosporaceae bacterium]